MSAADFYIQREMPEGDFWPLGKEVTGELRGMGATFMRVTRVPERNAVIFEGWKERPAELPPFHMWTTHANAALTTQPVDEENSR